MQAIHGNNGCSLCFVHTAKGNHRAEIKCFITISSEINLWYLHDYQLIPLENVNGLVKNQAQPDEEPVITA